MIRVVIADDMEDIREYLREIFAGVPDEMEVAATATTGKEAVEAVLRESPDIVLMDIQMETRMAGIQAIETIHRLKPSVRCIALTIHENDEYLFRAYQAGTSDYIIKTMQPGDILQAIRDVHENELMLRPQVAKKIIGEYQRLQANQSRVQDVLKIMMLLSATEYEVLKLVNDGYNYRAISQMRYVEETTVRSQINHILKKFGKKHMRDVVHMLRDMDILPKLQ